MLDLIIIYLTYGDTPDTNLLKNLTQEESDGILTHRNISGRMDTLGAGK
jgi:hypothetical protein